VEFAEKSLVGRARSRKFYAKTLEEWRNKKIKWLVSEALDIFILANGWI